MSDVKWIKLSVNVFDDEKFDAIKTLQDSNDIQLVWVKLLCLAGTCNENGFLVLTKEIPYTDEMLANRFHMDIGVVQRAMMMFQKLEMIEVTDNAYMVSNWLKYQNGDRLEDIRRKDRERKKRQKEQQLLGQKDALDGSVPDNENENSMEIPWNDPRKFTGICSYSISNNNIHNLMYLLNNNIYKDSEYILNNNELLTSIQEWMIYKDNKKPKSQHHYDTEMGMSKLLTQIVNNAKKYGTEAVKKCIDNSIANNYQGIIWDRAERYKPDKSIAEDIATW